MKNFNTYMEPMIDELLKLWVDGVEAYDAVTKETFQLYAMYLWSLHDYPGYGVFSSLQTQGFKACPPCGPDVIESEKCMHLNKVVYLGHRKYLPLQHRYRSTRNKKLFNGKSYSKIPKPGRTNGRFWEAQWKKVQDNTLSLKDSGMKEKSILFRLPYYKVGTQ